MRYERLRIPVTVALWVFVALTIYWLARWIYFFDSSSAEAMNYSTVGTVISVIEVIAFTIAACLWTFTKFGRPVVIAAVSLVLALEIGFRVFSFVDTSNLFEVPSNFWTSVVPVASWFTAEEFGYTGFEFFSLLASDIFTFVMVAVLVFAIMMRPETLKTPVVVGPKSKVAQTGVNFCPNCGTPRPTSGAFCPNCGTGIPT
jgi:hypothetical protein